MLTLLKVELVLDPKTSFWVYEGCVSGNIDEQVTFVARKSVHIEREFNCG